MKELVFYFYGYIIFFYSMGLIISYVVLMWLAEVGILRRKNAYLTPYAKYIIDKSPYTPGVSIIAPAYNEEKTIVDNVNSLLAQDYPIFEVIIVNDGSKDKTLELLIENFQLVEVPFAYVEHIHTKPYRRLLKSTNPDFRRLIVVDKENHRGGQGERRHQGRRRQRGPERLVLSVLHQHGRGLRAVRRRHLAVYHARPRR